MTVILVTLACYALVILYILAAIKGYFGYRKAKILWLGKERTVYYSIKERVSPGGLKYDCYVTDPHLLYFTYGDHIWLSVEGGEVRFAYVYLSGTNSLAKKSWLRDMIIKLPQKMGFSEAMDALKDKMLSLTPKQFSTEVGWLTNPEDRAFQKILDQLPVPRSPEDATEIIRNLPGK